MGGTYEECYADYDDDYSAGELICETTTDENGDSYEDCYYDDSYTDSTSYESENYDLDALDSTYS